MVVLSVDNSESTIQGLSTSELKVLRGLLSYELPTQPGALVRKASLVTPKGTFATGLLVHVIDYIASNMIRYELRDQRVIPKSKPGMFRLNLKD